MEEDIKILKHIAIAYKDDEKINSSLVNISTSTLITNGELAQAIENILNRLEQLEKENKELKESHDYIYEAYQDAGKKMFDYQEQLDDSIPKSVIREKIEEYKKYGLKRNIGSFIDMSTYKAITYEEALDELKEELLGEENDKIN